MGVYSRMEQYGDRQTTGDWQFEVILRLGRKIILNCQSPMLCLRWGFRREPLEPPRQRCFGVFGLIPVDLDPFQDFAFPRFRTRLSQHLFSFRSGKLEIGTTGKIVSGTWAVLFRHMGHSTLDPLFSINFFS